MDTKDEIYRDLQIWLQRLPNAMLPAVESGSDIRLLKHFYTPEEAKVSLQKQAIWLRCRNCQHVWYPDARKWRGQNPIYHDKVLRCPKCNVKNIVPKAVIEFFMETVKKETEYGFGKPPK